mmetsp:Transcript_5433/g.20733  ORF Transcript_5433/g.20733 Transcript_5433/m.20733 type:complete len:587 (-) Transcript_5433:1278-3038(-)
MRVLQPAQAVGAGLDLRCRGAHAGHVGRTTHAGHAGVRIGGPGRRGHRHAGMRIGRLRWHTRHARHAGVRGSSLGWRWHRHAGVARTRRRLAHVHARHAAATHVHAGHAHIGHGAHRFGPQLGHRRAHANFGSQRAARVADARDGGHEDRVRLGFLRLHDDIVGFAVADAELVHFHRVDVLAVGLHHRHRQARDAHVVQVHRGGIDEAQPHALTRLEQPSPVLAGALALQQERPLIATIAVVGGFHAHLGPLHALGPQRIARFGVGCAAQPSEELRRGHPAVVVVTVHLLQIGQHLLRRGVDPVGDDDDVVAVVLEGVGLGGLDDERREVPRRLLQRGVAVVPIGSGLPQLEAVGEGLAGADAGVGDAGHTVLVVGHEQAVPVNAGDLAQLVGDADHHLVAFAESQHRARHRAVDGDALRGLAGDVERGLGHGQVVGARHRGVAQVDCPDLRPDARQGGQRAQAGQGLQGSAFERIHPVGPHPLVLLYGFDRGDDDGAFRLLGGEHHLVAGLDLVQQRRVLDLEDHGHAGHVQVLDVAVLQGDLPGFLVDLAHFAFGHRGGHTGHVHAAHLAVIHRLGVCADREWR